MKDEDKCQRYLVETEECPEMGDIDRLFAERLHLQHLIEHLYARECNACNNHAYEVVRAVYLAILLLCRFLIELVLATSDGRYFHALELLRYVPLDRGLVAHRGRGAGRKDPELTAAQDHTQRRTMAALRALINRLWLNPHAIKPFQYRGEYRTPTPA